MAIAFVNSGSTNVSATSITLTYSSSAGNCLVLVMTTSGTSQLAPAVVDSASNVWVRVFTTGTTVTTTFYICLNAAAITSVGLSGLTNTAHELMIAEYSGVADWRTLTNSANATSTTASISSTLNAANNWLIAAGGHTGTSGGVFSASSGNIRVQQASSSTRRAVLIDNTAASATSVTCSATLTSQPWVLIDIELIPVQNLNIVNLTFGFTNASQNSYTSDVIKPANGDLIIAFCHTVSVTPAAFNKLGYPIVTGCNLTWNVANGSANNAMTRKHWIVWAIADSGVTSTALTFSFPTAPNNAFGWSIERVRGYDTTTPISWCVQIVPESVGTTSIHNPSVTMPALQDSSSLVYAALFTSIADANMTPAAGWTKFLGTSTVIQAVSKVNDNVPSWTNVVGTTTQDMITAIEITASNSGARNNPLQKHFLAAMGCS